MKPIEFKKYPNILPYVEHLLDKSYFRPSESNILSEETFVEIVTEWINHYEKNIDVVVKNTMLLYDLTSEEVGYNALGKDWEHRKKFKLEKRFDESLVRSWWKDKFVACIAHFYQAWINDYKEFSSGATGCLITCNWSIRFVDSDLKRVEKIAVTTLNMHLDIGCGLHSAIDIFDN